MPIEAGQFVCDYAGELLSRAGAAARAAASDASSAGHYLLVVREHINERVLCTHVDASRAGSMARFANHSCEPNTRLVPVRRGGFVPHLALRAIHNIAAHDELTFDYGAGRCGGLYKLRYRLI